MLKLIEVSRKHTSCHSVNADGGLSIIGKFKWLILNALNNFFPFSAVDTSLIQKDFKVSDLSLNWQKIGKSASPARKLCDLFWLHLPLHHMENELGCLRAIEIGCGSGTYGFLLNKILEDRMQYKGIDINPHPTWKLYQSKSNYEFLIADSGDIRNYLKDSNFIFTQSALEHFEEDLTFFHQIAEFVRDANYPIIQVHLIPSASCITTFTWHGIRQYTPRNISKITELFSEKTQKTLYRLGSSNCNKVHRKWISNPRYLGVGDGRKRDLSTYDQELMSAIKDDMYEPGKKEACFYALVLKSVPPESKKA
jgi:hypothetical protein